VVAKTVHCRHVTAKRSTAEWNEHFEFPLLGLDTIIKVSVKCKGKISDDKSLGSAFVPLRDFNILDKPTTRWFSLSLQSKSHKEGKGAKGQIQLTIAFVTSTKGTDALDLATADDLECGQSAFKKFSFGRLSLRRSLRRQNSCKSENDFFKQQDYISNGIGLHSFPENGKMQSKRLSLSTMSGNGGLPLSSNGSVIAKKSISLPKQINERPESLPVSENGHLSGQSTPTGEAPSDLETPQGSGQVVVRLRRRRTISGSHTPTTPSRTASFVYTNGITKSMLNGTMENDDSGSVNNGGLPSRNSPPALKEEEETEGFGTQSTPRSTTPDDRLKRFERRSLRLRDYKPACVNGEIHNRKGNPPNSKQTSSPKLGHPSSCQNSSPEGSPYHSRNRSELSMESNSSGSSGNQPFTLPSDASQRLQLLSSSSSSLTVSSSTSSHSLQHSTPTTVVANGNQMPLPPTPLTEEDTPMPSPFPQDEVTMTTQNHPNIDDASHGLNSSDVKSVTCAYSPEEKVDKQKEEKLPEGTSDENSSESLSPPVPQSLEQSKASAEQEQQKDIESKHVDQERFPSVKIRSAPIGQSNSHPSFSSQSTKAEVEPISGENVDKEVKKSKLVRRHTVQYSKDVTKFHGDFVLDSVLPPSLMNVLARTSSVQKGEFPHRGESPGDPFSASETDIPPRPHSVPHTPHVIRVTTPTPGWQGSSGNSGPPLSPSLKTDSTRKLHSSSVPLRRRASVKGMTKLLNLSAQALRHKSSTLPRPPKKTDSASDQVLSSSSSPKHEKSTVEGVDGKTCPSSSPSRASSISMTSTASRKELVDMSREELLGEVLNRSEEIQELKEQLEALKSYNTCLLEKVILHCPELLDISSV
jgi:hypothetical protein